MGIQRGFFATVLVAALAGGLVTVAQVQEKGPEQGGGPKKAQNQGADPKKQGGDPKADKKAPPFDAVADAQTPRQVPVTRPEQKKNEHDKSGIFSMDQAP